MKRIIILSVFIIFTAAISNATTVNGRILISNYSDTLYTIKLQINTDTGTDKMGGATIILKYDTAQICFPDFPIAGKNYLFHNFSGGTYSPALVTKVSCNRLWLNIELNTDNQGAIVAGKNDWTDIATLYFNKKVQSVNESIAYETGNNFWSIFGDDNSTIWENGSFNIVTGIQHPAASAGNFELLQNYPNPFNPSTTISFNLKNCGKVNLSVYNILGELVKTLINSDMNSGHFKVNFNAAELASGVYLYRLSVNNSYTAIKKMILLK